MTQSISEGRRAVQSGFVRLGLLLALFVALGTSAIAQQAIQLTTEQRATAEAAMSQLRSPYTSYHTVDMCPSADALRDSIRVAAVSGMSTDEIVEDVIARHGEQIRILPKRTGPGLWAWVLPPLVIVLGAAGIANVLRKSRPVAPVSGSISEEERGELAAALREWERGGGEEP